MSKFHAYPVCCHCFQTPHCTRHARDMHKPCTSRALARPAASAPEGECRGETKTTLSAALSTNRIGRVNSLCRSQGEPRTSYATSSHIGHNCKTTNTLFPRFIWSGSGGGRGAARKLLTACRCTRSGTPATDSNCRPGSRPGARPRTPLTAGPSDRT